MNRYKNQLLLACLLLLSQTTVLAHDVQHLGSAHGELCAVYLSQDHSALSAAVDYTPPITFSPERFQVSAADVTVAVATPAYASRAPPRN